MPATATATAHLVVRMDTDPDLADQGEYYRRTRRPLLALPTEGEWPTRSFPVYVYVANLHLRTDLAPGEACLHFWDGWDRFGSATCKGCNSHGWSPYFVADDVMSDDTQRYMLDAWQLYESHVQYFEEWAAELTAAAR